jgi:CHAD domain-containing protein
VKTSRERELKFTVPSGFRLASFDGAAGMVVRRRLLATYFDTDDLRLARFGVTLRHRTGEGWTLKLPEDSGGGFLARSEIVVPGPVRQVPAELVDLALAYTRGRPLEPRARLRTSRRVVALTDGDGASLGEIVDDGVSILGADGSVVEHFRELELETADAMPAKVARRLVRVLQAAGADPTDQTPKVFRALGPAALAAADVAVDALPDQPTAGDVVRRALATSVVRLIRHDPVVRLDADLEGVHKARVATRTLRSDLRTFRPLVDRHWADDLRGELGWLGALLGRVRDADVLLLRLERAEAPVTVVRSLRADRDQALAELLEAMRGERYLGLLDRLVGAASSPELADEAAKPAREVVPQLARRQWRSLQRAVGSLGRQPSDEELHEVRIKAKRCRYAAEAAAPVLGKRAAAFARATAGLQQALGDLNDAAVAEGWLRDWAKGRRASAAVFAAGELAASERAAARKLRTRWRSSWKALVATRPRSFA